MMPPFCRDWQWLFISHIEKKKRRKLKSKRRQWLTPVHTTLMHCKHVCCEHAHSRDIVRFSVFSCFAVFYLILDKAKSFSATSVIFRHTKCWSVVSRWRKSHVYTISGFWDKTIQSNAAKDGTPRIISTEKIICFVKDILELRKLLIKIHYPCYLSKVRNTCKSKLTLVFVQNKI